jgi:Family of unknown function (DUF5677)
VSTILNEDELPRIDPVKIDADMLKDFRDEDDFIDLAVQLVVEAASYTVIAHSIMDEQGGWDRDEAILGGLMVRLYKLLSALLDQVCQHRAEIAQIMCRLAFEAIVDIRYLVRKLDAELGDDFVKSSYRQERILRDQIMDRITERGGEVLPVEDRMLKSINRAADIADLCLDDVSTKRRTWGGQDTRAKAREVFGDDLAYIAAFSGMSQSVHGSWGDLLQFHLETEDGKRFTPSPEWGHPRPQHLTSMAFLVAQTVDDFLGYWDEALQARFRPALADLQRRVRTLASGHEHYLSSKEVPATR